MQLGGIHRLTAVTADASRNHAFYTRTLGLRLIKRTVNQDDVGAYHLFYGDGLASPGTDITFFDWPVARERRGTGTVVRTHLRVAGETVLHWWEEHLSASGVAHAGIGERDGRRVLDFEDFEGQRLTLVDDGGAGSAHPWDKSPVPPQHQIRGLGPVTISVPDRRRTDQVLTTLLGMRVVRDYATAQDASAHTFVYEMGQGGAGAELHVVVEPGAPLAQQGAGGVHHVAFRVPDAEYAYWTDRLRTFRVPSSGPIDRYYFRSLYFREPSGTLFEIATEGPGFTADEPLENLGETLALPPFLEDRRQAIEAGLKPL